MSIVKLLPAFKDYLWGGTKLKQQYNKKTDYKIVAESWEVSTHPDGPSKIIGGKYSGKTLGEYIKEKGDHILGSNAKAFDYFPILVKLIDAQENLSIQVHPSDDYAIKKEGEYGKTEMWYILDAKKDSTIYYGTKKNINKKEFKDSIRDNKVLDVLKKVPVKKGDVVFVEPGTIHAIGAGIVLCEIQQNSNLTYRVYDFDRTDSNGAKRELHIDKAVEVSNLSPLDTSFRAQEETEHRENYRFTSLIEHEMFKVQSFEFDGPFDLFINKDSFSAIVCLRGTLKFSNDKITLQKGESAFLDANTGIVRVKGQGEFIRVMI